MAGETTSGAAAPVETELKLRGDPEALLRLWQAEPLRGPAGAAPKVKQLENVYYDTADLRLRKLRPRRDRGGRPARAGR